MLLSIFAFVALFLFIILSLVKAVQYAKMPMHGRLDLYPVPKDRGKIHHGGSYYEDLEWWKKPRDITVVGEIKDMLAEMLLIKKLFENQQPLWWISYSLHLGIYLLIAWTAMLFVGAVTEMAGVAVVAGSESAWGMLVYYITFITGGAGAILTALGSGALFLKRLLVSQFGRYTTAQEYFNLVFIFVVAVTGINVWLSDLGFNYGRHIAQSIMTFQPIQADSALGLHIVLLGLLIIYIPLTKMSHYVGKYFTFHKVLWDNDPNLPGSEIDKKIKASAGFKPSKNWSAPHFQANKKA